VEGPARGRLSGLVVTVALVMAYPWTAASASVGSTEQSGAFALLGGTPKIVSKFWAEHGNGLTATLKIRQFRLDGTTPILDYDVDMQRLMHVVIVRDDFATFDHLHPSFDATTGTFSQAFTKAPNHRYYVYADSTPHGIGQQVFRFVIESDGPIADSIPSLSASATTAVAGAYTVTVGRTTLPANSPLSLNVTIRKNAQPARDLKPYLGAAAHVVFISTSALAYVHVHPAVLGAAPMTMSNGMAMSGEAGPFLQAELPPLSAGAYKAWIQFMGANDALYTAGFTLVAR